MSLSAALLVAAGALGALGACRTAPSAAAAGAASSPGAVESFLTAAHAGNQQAMASLFGTSSGPITGREPPNDVEKRMRALQCYLTHDSARIVDDLPGVGSERQVTVELKQGGLTRRTAFTTVAGPHSRWFVKAFDIQTVVDLCRP